ncbi:hypothetical protein GCM10010869_34210 [Mesorhizobium tianshanense]|uniref:Type I restriction enzyme S subunit n=1 Tax=Mesorhizobium tianshanense TaxID=39844 RepID=A0A562MT76_9HYPH|nr:restriction endonuclease subunit S [Mesorhizobium tianshanense]TWI22791.1 type I restriction enzyme S subunit [Mesorhizobium tianshanense]GLS37827.1 hypothetical protein GCM10010869_34210 [Mesorhizobium tianshanense]
MTLPMRWSHGTLDDVISSVRGGFSAKCDDRQALPSERAVLKTGAVLNGRFDATQNKYVPPSEHASLRTPVSAGTIVFCRKNSEDTIGAAALVERDDPNIFLSDLLWELRPATGVDLHWLVSSLKCDRTRKLIQIEATGTQSTMKNISQGRLLSVPVAIPPLPEQRKIAEILRTWDVAIQKLEALRAGNLRRRVWLRSHLFTGRTRLPGYSGTWREVPLGEVLTEHGLQGTGAEQVFSVSVHKGLVNQIEHLGRSFAASETGHYNRVLPGDIVYTKSPTGDFPLGIIKQSKIGQEVIVSPLYGVFTPATYAFGVILDALFESPIAVRNYLHPLVQKGAKNTIAITNCRFLEGKLRLPMDPAEQAAIAEIVEASQSELACIEAEIQALTRQKRGLMQKLLTGEWRVSC